MDITFKVTPSQKETIDSRMLENGFDEISAYLKVIALKTQAFKLTSAGLSSEEASIELGFKVSQAQKLNIEEKMKESDCQDIQTYCKYVALHAVVYAIVEVRSTGDFDAMLKRITQSRSPNKLTRLF